MALQSIGSCPWCKARMLMKKKDGVFTCPVCSCKFKHNWKTWPPCLVGSALLIFIIYRFIPFTPLAMAATIFIMLIVVAFLGPYVIISSGCEDVTEEEVRAHSPKMKESKWFIVLVIIIALAIAFFLVLVNL